MLKIEKLNSWYLIEDKIMFNPSEFMDNYINIMAVRWQDMNYGKASNFKIDFPWEYDKESYFFKVYEWEDWKLNYFIRFADKRIALILTPWIIEKEQFEDIDCWVFDNDYTNSILDKLEIEWERINLSTIE